jgi:hypothetical protein
LTSATTDGVAYYRHHPRTGDGGKGCGFCSIRAETVEGPVLDYLYRWFVDQPAFDIAITMALPPASERTERQAEAGRVETRLAEAQQGIRNLARAVAKGADPELLIGEQDNLKAEVAALGARLKTLRGELAEMPDPDALREEAEVVRGMLAREHTGKDWRKESFDDIRRFLHFLFGDNPGKVGLGIFVAPEGELAPRGRAAVGGRWTAEVWARLRLRGPEFHVGDDGLARLVGADPSAQLVEGEPFARSVDLLGTTRSRTAPGCTTCSMLIA